MPHTSLSFHNAPRPPAHLLPRDASFLCLTRQSQLFLTHQLSCAAVPGTTQDPKLCFHNQHILQVSHLFVNQNPLPLATWPASFYVDNTFCHLGKRKQISRPSHFFFSYWRLVDIQYPAFLVTGRKVQEERKRKRMQAWALSVSHKEIPQTQYLNPLLPILAWKHEYLILNLCGTPRAGLAGSHVILICFLP